MSTSFVPILQSTLTTPINSVIHMICEVDTVVLLSKLVTLFMNINQMTCNVTHILYHTHSFSFRSLLEIIKGNEAKAPGL
jgi:hypothetical protein